MTSQELLESNSIQTSDEQFCASSSIYEDLTPAVQCTDESKKCFEKIYKHLSL